MPTIFTHALSGWILSKGLLKDKPKRFWLLSILLPLLPEADVIAFRFGIPYEHVLGHRGITHSIFFAICVGIAVSFLAFRNSGFSMGKLCLLALWFSLITASHGILDAMTSGGKGVALLAPFDNSRYFFDFRPIRVSPIRIEVFLGKRGLLTLWSELRWVILPLSIFSGVMYALLNKKRPSR